MSRHASLLAQSLQWEKICRDMQEQKLGSASPRPLMRVAELLPAAKRPCVSCCCAGVGWLVGRYITPTLLRTLGLLCCRTCLETRQTLPLGLDVCFPVNSRMIDKWSKCFSRSSVGCASPCPVVLHPAEPVMVVADGIRPCPLASLSPELREHSRCGSSSCMRSASVTISRVTSSFLSFKVQLLENPDGFHCSLTSACAVTCHGGGS
jgi:hypothetical protein